MRLNADELKNTHQTIAVFCLWSTHISVVKQKWLKSKMVQNGFTVPLCWWWVFHVLNLSFSYVPTLSALTVSSLKSSLLTVLSCFPQTPSSSSQHPLLFSLRCLSLPFYCFSASLVCLLSRLASLPPPLSQTVLTGHRRSFIFLLCGIILWMCVEKGTQEALGGGHHVPCVLLSILICWAAAWGRLVLVMCCAISRCSCLLLITSLIVPAYTAGVLVERNRTQGHFSVCLCVPLWVGGEECMCIYYGPPSTSCSPHRDKLGRGAIKALSSLIHLWAETGKVGMFFLIPSAHIAQIRGKVPGQRLATFPTTTLKRFPWSRTALKILVTFFSE